MPYVLVTRITLTSPSQTPIANLIDQQLLQEFAHHIAAMFPGMLYVHDLIKRRNFYINRQVGEVFGYTPEQIEQMGDRVLERLMHSEDFARVPTHFAQFQTAIDHQVLNFEYRMRRVGAACDRVVQFYGNRIQ
jgi:PAS domain-containing protein